MEDEVEVGMVKHVLNYTAARDDRQVGVRVCGCVLPTDASAELYALESRYRSTLVDRLTGVRRRVESTRSARRPNALVHRKDVSVPGEGASARSKRRTRSVRLAACKRKRDDEWNAHGQGRTDAPAPGAHPR